VRRAELAPPTPACATGGGRSARDEVKRAVPDGVRGSSETKWHPCSGRDGPQDVVVEGGSGRDKKDW
jgi:hypothetical protein